MISGIKIQGVSKKTFKCLFVWYLRNQWMDFNTVFFFWKLRSICKFWIQNQFCVISGGWDICKTKLVSGIEKYIFILTWSGPHSTRKAWLAPDWPGHIPRHPQGPQVAPNGLSGCVGATQGPVGAFQGHSSAVRTISGQYEYLLFYSGTSFCFANISAS